MKGNCRRAILSLVSAVILLISVTYAWILSNGALEGKFIVIDFKGTSGSGTLSVVSAEVGVEFLYQDTATGNFVVKANDDTTPLVLSGMVPNDMLPFKIRFYNDTGESQIVSLSITGITTDAPALLTQMYVGVSGGSGYANTTDANVVKPDNLFLRLNEATKRTNSDIYDLKLYNALVIPPLMSGQYVELDCFFWLDRTTEIELAGKTITISNFRILI